MIVDWTKVEKIIGAPDYAVVFSVWPWPDGGWMAGICLINKGYAEEQGLPRRICRLNELQLNNVKWGVVDGFQDGINVHAPTPNEVIDELYSAVR